MKYLAMFIAFIATTFIYWAPIAVGIAALVDGHWFGLLFIAGGLWLAFRA